MQPYQDRPSGSDFELRDLLAIVRRQAIPIVIVIVVVMAAAAVHTFRKPDVYQSSAGILVDFEALDVGRAGSVSEANRTLENEIEVLQSAEVRQAANEAAGRAVSVSAAASDDSDVIVLAASSGDPEQAAESVNVYAQTYIDARLATVLEDLENRRAEVDEQIGGIETELTTLQDQIRDLYSQRSLVGLTDPQYDQLSQEIATAEGTRNARSIARDNLRQQSTDLTLSIDATRDAGGLELLAEAQVPASPSSPDHRKDLLVGLAAALVLAAAVAFVREQLDDSVRTKEELERQSRLPVLGIVPKVGSWRDERNAHLETRLHPRSAASEAYRTLLTSLDFLGIERRVQVLQITSASPGEGKTTTAANLAVAYADAGRRTLIVCCDLRRPRLHRFFGVEADPGFTSVLLGTHDLAEAAVPVLDTPGLHVLAAGPLPSNPAELLRGARSRELVARLREDYDVVVIDSPPVLPVADALVLAGEVDATLVVASAHNTTRRRLRRALEALRQVDATLVGTVFNGVQAADDYGYDVTYYGYDDKERGRGRGSRNGNTRSSNGAAADGAAAAAVDAGHE